MKTDTLLSTSSYFETAFKFFNKALFADRLPPCALLVGRKRGAHGYFWPEQWAALDKAGLRDRRSEKRHHEITMNPHGFHGRTTEEVLSTLVHEMTHLEQQMFGKPGAGAYHNREWVGLMEAVGLTPYAADGPRPEPGETPKKQTGNRVTHVIDPGGRFDKACAEFIKAHGRLQWGALKETPTAAARAKAKRQSKTKFTCPSCDANAWGKPDLLLVCGDCAEPMEAAR